ncbi:hypothetical protein [Bosea sp. ANAM02]|uniref:hypothetical protein n=1 Tax=Bosea sp. ANAM02 TaxID=2020412 RepID=UPI00140F1939|nr:hypothetical protein [Bosea sp. ANAM02]BCB22323.1 hypothetical protein OCUBac02_52170 [Bosea sp. ANAM02]
MPFLDSASPQASLAALIRAVETAPQDFSGGDFNQALELATMAAGAFGLRDDAFRSNLHRALAGNLIAATNLMRALLPSGCWYRLEGRDDAIVCSVHDATGAALSVGGHLGNPALALSLAVFKAVKIECVAPARVEQRVLMPAAVSTLPASDATAPIVATLPAEAAPAQPTPAPAPLDLARREPEFPTASVGIVEQMAALEALLGQDFEQRRASWLA